MGLRQFLGTQRARFRQRLRRLVNDLLSRCIRFVLAFPKVSKLLRAVIRRLPFIERRLKARVLGAPEAASVFAAAEAVTARPTELCDHAGWIHSILLGGDGFDRPVGGPSDKRSSPTRCA